MPLVYDSRARWSWLGGLFTHLPWRDSLSFQVMVCDGGFSSLAVLSTAAVSVTRAGGLAFVSTELRSEGMRWKNVPEGEVIRKLSKGTRLHQEERTEEPPGEAGRARRGGAGAGSTPPVSPPPPAHATAARRFSKPLPLGFLWRPEVGKSYGKLRTHCKVSIN